MRINDGSRGVEARVRHAPETNSAVVGRDILQKLVHSVCHVRAFIRLPRRGLIDVRMHIDELTLRLESPAHILEHKI